MTTPLMTRHASGGNGKRLMAAAIVVGCALVLTSCAGNSEDGFSAFVADHWPRWAGGMPDDVPPRPGTPGYQTFIAHGQADQNVSPQSATGANAPAVPAKPVFQSTLPSPAAPATPAAPAAPVAPAVRADPQSASGDSNIVRGGLY